MFARPARSPQQPRQAASRTAALFTTAAAVCAATGPLTALAMAPQHAGYDPVQPQEYAPAVTVMVLFWIVAAICAVGALIARRLPEA
mgnify:CR=1 FL=1